MTPYPPHTHLHIKPTRYVSLYPTVRVQRLCTHPQMANFPLLQQARPFRPSQKPPFTAESIHLSELRIQAGQRADHLQGRFVPGRTEESSRVQEQSYLGEHRHQGGRDTWTCQLSSDTSLHETRKKKVKSRSLIIRSK